MKEFLVYLLKSGVCLTIFLMIYHFLLRTTTFFKLNRGFLLIGLVVSFTIPAITYTYDVIDLGPIVSFKEDVNLVNDPTLSKVSEVDVDYSELKPIVTAKNKNVLMIKLYYVWMVLFVIYLVVIGLILIRNLVMGFKLRKLSKSGSKGFYEGCRLINTPLAKTPFAAMNTIFADLNKMSGDLAKTSILKHETVHVKQRHWVDLILAELALTFQWFNPVMWVYMRRMKDNHEYLADQGVIKMGISPSTYKAVLINERMQADIFRVTSPFSGSSSLGRLAMMKKEPTAAWKKILILIILPILGLFLWMSSEPNYLLFNLDTFSVKVIGDVTKVDKDGYPVVDGVSMHDIYFLSQIGSFEDAIPSSLRTKKMGLYTKLGTNGTLVIKTGEGRNAISNTNLIDYVKQLSDVIILIDGNAASVEDLTSLNSINIASLSYLVDDKMLSQSGDMITVSKVTGFGEKSPKLLKTDNLDIALIKDYNTSLSQLSGMPVMIEGKSKSNSDLRKINPGKINVLSILTTPKYTQRYGKRAENGIIIVK